MTPPSRLDLLLTKRPDVVSEIKCDCSMRKGDHVKNQFIMRETREEVQYEQNRRGKFN